MQASPRRHPKHGGENEGEKEAKDREHGKSGGRVSTWLFTIARNRLADHYRSEQRSQRAHHSRLRLTARDSTIDPATGAAFEEERARVAGWLAQLPEEQQEVVTLRLLGDVALAEIAEITQTPLATVKSRLRYGLGKIGTMLAKETSL